MGHYVDSEKFGELIKLAQDTGKASDELADMGGTIGRELLKRYRFSGITRDEAYSIGALLVCSKFNKYKPGKGKPFNFFTTIILNEFRGIWRDGDRYNKLLQSYANHLKDKEHGKGRRVQKTQPKPDEHNRDSGNDKFFK